MSRRWLTTTQRKVDRKVLATLKRGGKGYARRIVRWVQPTWEAVVCALDLCRCQIPIEEVARLKRWLTLTAVFRGTDFAASTLKWAAAAARYYAAIDGSGPAAREETGPPPPMPKGTPRCLNQILLFLREREASTRVRNLIQFSYIGRGLPPCSDKVLAEAVTKHADRLKTEVLRNPELERRLREWCRTWAESRKGVIPDYTALSASGSACLSLPRKEGGLNAALRNILNRWEQEPAERDDGLYDRFPSFRDPTRYTEEGDRFLEICGRPTRDGHEYRCNILAQPELERERVARILRDESLKWLWRRGANMYPGAGVIGLKERGYKARIVTKSPAELVQLAHMLRGLVWPMLEADPRVAAALDGGRLETVVSGLVDDPIRVPKDMGGLCAVSADLTAATDGLADWAIQAAWGGVCDGAGFAADIREIGEVVLGPMMVEYKGQKGVPDQVFRTKRGCLMGLPLSWFILNLVNLWAAEDAVAAVYPTAEDRLVRESVRLSVCGDDLAAIMPIGAHQNYRSNIEAVGSSFSLGKHLVSDHLLLFTEQVATFQPVEVPYPTWTVAGKAGFRGVTLGGATLVNAMPVKALVHPGHFAERHSKGSEGLELPSWATAGPAISSAIPSWADQPLRRRVAKLAKVLRPERRRLIDAGIPPELPRAVGGGGYPPTGSTIRGVNRHWRRAIAYFFYRAGGIDWRLLQSCEQADSDLADLDSRILRWQKEIALWSEDLERRTSKLEAARNAHSTLGLTRQLEAQRNQVLTRLYSLRHRLRGAESEVVRLQGLIRRLPQLRLQRQETLRAAEELRSLRNQWLVVAQSGDVLEAALSEAPAELALKQVGEVTDQYARPGDARLTRMTGASVVLTESDALLRLAAAWVPAMVICGFEPPRAYCMRFWTFVRRLRKHVGRAASKISGRGQPLRSWGEDRLLTAVSDLADGRVFVLPREFVPSGLGLFLGNRGTFTSRSWGWPVRSDGVFQADMVEA